MTTLGQMLQAASTARQLAGRMTDEQMAASEAKRIKAKTDSLTQAINKAKVDIATAIIAGKDEFSIGSKVPEDNSGKPSMEPAYAYLKRLANKRCLNDDAMLHPLWDTFLEWATSQDLRIELVHCLPDIVDGEQVGGFYMRIRARPINSVY